MFCLHSGITNLSLYKHWLKLYISGTNVNVFSGNCDYIVLATKEKFLWDLVRKIWTKTNFETKTLRYTTPQIWIIVFNILYPFWSNTNFVFILLINKLLTTLADIEVSIIEQVTEKGLLCLKQNKW